MGGGGGGGDIWEITSGNGNTFMELYFVGCSTAQVPAWIFTKFSGYVNPQEDLELIRFWGVSG